MEAFGMSCLRPSSQLRAETTYSWILCRHHPLPQSGLRALPTTLPWLLDPELQLFLWGMGHSIHAGSFLHQHGAWSLVDHCEGSELYLRWTSSLRESQAGEGGGRVFLWFLRVGNLPQQQGRPGSMGLWKLCHGLLRLTPEVRVEEGRMGEERRAT